MQMLQPTDNIVVNQKSNQVSLSASQRFMLELAPIAKNLAKLPETLTSLVPYQTKTTEKIVQHVFSSGGKRVRPALFLLCADLVDYRGDQLLKVAAIAEYVHTASLLHDDVVDSSSRRRGAPTPNSLWGNQAAVLVGDLVYARACELMAQTGKIELVQIFGRAIRKMSEGELLQQEIAFDYNVTLKDYLNVLEGKTGVLIGASCAAAPILADLDSTKVKALYDFGNKLGLAFQLIDDALDFRADSENLGKPVFADLSEGKLTYPVLKLKEVASEDELKELKRLIECRDTSQAANSYICSMVAKYKTTQDTLAFAQKYTEDAVQSLVSNFSKTETRDRIERVAKLLLTRNS